MISNNTEVFVLTKEDWCPSYQCNDSYNKRLLLRVSFFELQGNDSLFRVCVWGSDDMGMDYDTPDRELAEQYFIDCISQEYLSLDYLKGKGFYSA